MISQPTVRVALLVALICFSSFASAAPCYVNAGATGSNAGTSWANAYTDLQSALANYPGCQQIWVARGTYKPTATTDRTISFNVEPGVAIYGGFAGTEAKLSDRFLPANPTILSGHIGLLSANSGNSYHVVVMDGTTASGSILPTTILANLTISDGNANGAGANQGFGGGLYCNGQGAGHQCIPQLAAVIFENNSAGAGGAIYSDGHDGGVSNPYLHDAIVRNNTATGGGGGMHNDGSGGTSSPTIDKTTFTGNNGGIGGGAIYNDGTAGVSSPAVSNSTFYANTALLGGAILDHGPTAGHASPVLRYDTFYQNKATAGPGGAIYNYAPDGDAAPNISGVIFWADEATGVPVENYVNSQTASSLEYSITPECPPAAVGCINADPMLGPLQDNGGSAPTLRPEIGSPAIDHGNAANCTEVDERGITRKQGAECDLGAVELLPAETQRCYVNYLALPPSDGKSWATAYGFLFAALADTTCGEVWVTKGTYKPVTLGQDDRTYAFIIRPGKAVYGGFAGNETARSQRDPTTNVTILSGDRGAVDDTSDNVYHVVFIDAAYAAANITESTVLDGFTITAGNANGSEVGNEHVGGGLISNSGVGYINNVTLANLVFTNNSATYGGGALLINGQSGISSPRLQTVTFSGNHANIGGAVLSIGANGLGSPTYTAVNFTGNTADSAGGAIYDQNNNPRIVASHFDNNGAPYGGAVANTGANPSFIDVIFSDNTADYGGAVYSADLTGLCNLQFTSVTFTGNSAMQGGAVNSVHQQAASLASFDHVTFENNFVYAPSGLGGAVYASGGALFHDVLFAFNSIEYGGGGGGAVYNTLGHVLIDGSSFVGNYADRGGAVENEGDTGTALINNVTFWKNYAKNTAFGGAVDNFGGSIQLLNSTFGSNSATVGGALTIRGNGSETISNTIFWDDSASSGAEISVEAGSTVAIDHSIIQNGCPAGATCSTVSSADPLLGPFQFYGGFTPALMPAANSPALDNAVNCSAFDQRGVFRPPGPCDIGALERQSVEDYLFNNGFDW